MYKQAKNKYTLTIYCFSQVRVIPLELQRLFAHLLLMDQQSASTTQLTDSFGWKNNEVCKDTNTQ